MMNTLSAHIPTHPGDVLKEELQARNISQKKFAELIQVSYTMFNEVLNCKRPISADLALTLEAAINISADLWVNMQARYNLYVARNDERNTTRLTSIRSICASML